MGVFLGENMLGDNCLSLPLGHWIRAHRMAGDLVVSLVVFLPQIPIVLLVALNDYICPGCSAHQLLIYRDPGTLEREKVIYELEVEDGRQTYKPTCTVVRTSVDTPTSSEHSMPAEEPRMQ